MEPKTMNFDIAKGQHITINDRTAAEKIGEYPEAIQKLVWRALYYKREIETRKSMTLGRWSEENTKLSRYIDSFRHAQQLILKMCKRRNLRPIVIDGGFYGM